MKSTSKSNHAKNITNLDNLISFPLGYVAAFNICMPYQQPCKRTQIKESVFTTLYKMIDDESLH